MNSVLCYMNVFGGFAKCMHTIWREEKKKAKWKLLFGLTVICCFTSLIQQIKWMCSIKIVSNGAFFPVFPANGGPLHMFRFVFVTQKKGLGIILICKRLRRLMQNNYKNMKKKKKECMHHYHTTGIRENDIKSEWKWWQESEWKEQHTDGKELFIIN